MPDAQEGTGEFILYADGDGSQVQLRSVGGTVWLSQADMAVLYGTSIPNITQTIGRILDDGEVTEATINSELIVRSEGSRQVRREVKVYNLDMILAVGYRVTTARAVQFRQWATTVLHEYLVKGFALQDERLKDPAGVDYLTSFSSASGTSELRRSASTKRSGTSSLRPAWTTTSRAIWPASSSRLSRTSCCTR